MGPAVCGLMAMKLADWVAFPEMHVWTEVLAHANQSYTLWKRMLIAVKDRFPFKQDLEPEKKKWTDIKVSKL